MLPAINVMISISFCCLYLLFGTLSDTPWYPFPKTNCAVPSRRPFNPRIGRYSWFSPFSSIMLRAFFTLGRTHGCALLSRYVPWPRLTFLGNGSARNSAVRAKMASAGMRGAEAKTDSVFVILIHLLNFSFGVEGLGLDMVMGDRGTSPRVGGGRRVTGNAPMSFLGKSFLGEVQD